MAASPPPDPSQPRVVRVFVSSTFRDMHDEREELVKRVFPELRKMCEARGVTFVEVDLRWGISDEQKADGKVLPICLEEIVRCRPFFIGLLGERYGWVPESIPDELVGQQPWLAEHRDKSVTELEILHGVLRNPAMANRACFYFRDPAYAARRADLIEEDEGKRAKLAALKEKIRRSGLATEQYQDPQDLGRLVLRDLTVAINQLYPPDEVPDPLDREAAEHEAFARSRARVYIGRQEYFDQLDAHAAGDGPPLVILGESGSGKSALLANWALRYRESHPNDFLLMHFIGSSPYSSDWMAMLRRILGELKRRFGIQGDIPDKPDELRLAFASSLHMASARLAQPPAATERVAQPPPATERVAQPPAAVSSRRIILIFDALNQLEDRDGAPDLVWLPPVIPANVRLILSTLPGRPLDDLRRRGWPTLEVQPLTADERKRLIVDYLAQYRKTLAEAQASRIVARAQSANPLFLCALLEELRVFGSYERLDERIAHYLAAQSIPALYERILARYEEDYERDRPGLVRDAMTALWAARRGLSESELLDILGTVGPGGRSPLPRAIWSPLYLAAEPSLVTRSGLITFFHDYLREAVGHSYVATPQQQLSAHRSLAGYFGELDLGVRKVDELSWQLAKAEEWDRLRQVLSDFDFLQAAWDANRHELLDYWQSVRRRLRIRSGSILISDWRSAMEHGKSVQGLAELLDETGDREMAANVFDALIDLGRQRGQDAKLVRALEGRVAICIARREFAKARDLCQECVALYRKREDQHGLSRALGDLATALYEESPDRALELLMEQEGIARRIEDFDSIQRSLGDQSVIHSGHRGDLARAINCLRQGLQICREHGLLADAVGHRFNLAILLYRAGEWDWARANNELEALRQETETAGRRPLLAACLGQQGQMLAERGRPREALAKHRRAEILWREVEDVSGLIKCLSHQAMLLPRCHRRHEARRKAEAALVLMARHGYAPQARARLAQHLRKLRSPSLVALALMLVTALLLVMSMSSQSRWHLPLFGQIALAVGITCALRFLVVYAHNGPVPRCEYCRGPCVGVERMRICTWCGACATSRGGVQSQATLAM